MPILRSILMMLPLATMVLGAGSASGQAYPSRPIRMVTSGIGGGTDFAARLVAQGITTGLGQQIIIDNRQAGAIQGEIVAKALPDGYTLLFAGSDFWTFPLLQKVRYDPVRDFAPISIATSSPNILVVHPSLPAKSISELIALAKSKPGALNYGSSVTGTSTHFAAELFKSTAGVDIVRIGYKSGGLALNAVVAGEVQMYFAVAGSALTPLIQAGRLRALAVTSAQPSALAPGLPTVAASGLPGYEISAIQSVFAPAKTPPAIINRLNQEIVQFLLKPETKERLLNAAVEVIGSTPQQLADTVKSSMSRLGNVIKDAGIRAD